MPPPALPHILLLLLLLLAADPCRAAPSSPSGLALSAASAERRVAPTATPAAPAYLQPCTHFSQCNPGLFCYTLSPRTGLLNVCAANNAHIHGPPHKWAPARCFCHNRFRSCAASSDCHPHEACAIIRQRHPDPRPKQRRQNGTSAAQGHPPPVPPQQQNGTVTVARSVSTFCTPCTALDRGVRGVRATPIDTAHNCALPPPHRTSLTNGPSPFLSPSPVSPPSPSPSPSASAYAFAFTASPSPSRNAPMLYTLDRCRPTTHDSLLGSVKRCAPGRQCIDIVQSLKQREAVPCTATYFSVECGNNTQSGSDPSKHDCQDLQPSPHPSSGCVCAPDRLRFRSCARASDCPAGERCADVAAGLTSPQDVRRSVCVSCTQTLSANAVEFLPLDSAASLEEQCPQQFPESDQDGGPVEDLGEGICIAVHHLGDLRDRKELVFPRHRRAAVLCDAHGNCATAAHVVVVNGGAATMREYCAAERFAQVRMGRACSRRVMWVNSPRMRRGVRVQSRHAGVQFTAFAANGGTVVERWAIQLLVLLGM